MQLAGIRFWANQSKQASIQCKLNCGTHCHQLLLRPEVKTNLWRGRKSIGITKQKDTVCSWEIPALQLHQEKDCTMFACFHMFFLQHPLLARTRTGCWSWHSRFRPSVVIFQPCVKFLILQLCMQLILQLYSKKCLLLLILKVWLTDPGKVRPPKSDLSNAQTPRCISDASVSPPILLLCCAFLIEKGNAIHWNESCAVPGQTWQI